MSHTPSDAPRPRQFTLAGSVVPAARPEPGLHIVATPIGNLGDVTLRALQTLAGADMIACEDTRVTRRLLDRYGIETPLVAYHDHNAEHMRPRLIGRLLEGGVVALVSDAGTPLVSDPGYKLVEAAIAGGYRVIPVPGASASLAALVAAGLPTDRFFFEGFLPPKSGARRTRITELKGLPATLVLYESGPRLPESLADLAAGLGPRPAAVCRELTKAFEEVRRGPLDALAAHYAEAGSPKGEIVLVVGPPLAEEARAEDLDAALRRALASLSVKDAAAAVATATGLPKRAVYARALALQDGGDDTP
ncbi:16S rRNA (cytidine1402-2'-O)-methyltransferase [Angulomicrobium tetraedrale]|uniref:Ribosomal RNA small subunit methyltransferase I n=1 Tax=Ancylobacter tetraedralis TaxID=217068 RepID=A0A839Z7E6_9HYPH|nr:16S rRNA (cytidine(1402)-2'-O)-methyltransferase [Ancylobacter tetraedralis]MBB3770600.1 16S rRNA (cytidine1402-2'-O)-methyltransferase [Ancylobacter tetraedralis]